MSPDPKRDPSQRTTLLEAFAICIIIAGVAVIIYATGRSVGVDHGRDEITARQHYEDVKSRALAACADTEPTALRECVIKATETAQDQSDSRQDLFAQQDMSQWAYWMMLISSLTLFITGIGIVWIRDTLIETRRAVKAANDSVSVAREIGEAQVRAYVTIDGVTAVIDHQKRPTVEVSIRNNGASPAKNIRIIARCDIGPTGVLPEGFDHLQEDAHEIVMRGPRRISTEVRECLPFDVARVRTH